MTRAINHATFTQARVLVDLAERIVWDGAAAVLGWNLSASECRQWNYAAQLWLDTDGDDNGDFAGMVDEHYNPPRDRTWALDTDFLRDDRASWEMGL